ncbi:MFS general substrate transporter [Backusella circina FSU 941]|nr:MFS general substrate transporter [Backusella circina FSU 941]
MSEDGIPDGGYGWLVVIAGFLTNFIAVGDIIIWGVYLNAYLSMDLAVTGSTAEFMAVGTLAVASVFIFAPLSLFLYRFGFRFSLIIGSILMSTGLILASFSTHIWHLVLTQGFLFGIGSSINYMVILSVIPQWFSKRRGVALGISSSGTGIGGLVLSLLANYLINKYGVDWTYRTTGFISIGINVIVIVLLRTRPQPYKKKPSVFDFHVLKNGNFLMWLIGSGISLIGYYIPLYYMPKYCTSLGIESSKSSILVGIAAAMNTLGRPVLGIIGDRIGSLNAFIIASTLSGLSCLFIWPFSRNFVTMLIFSILYGFFGGIYFVVSPAITAGMVDVNSLNSGLSFLMFIGGVSSLGPPLSSLIQYGDDYLGVQLFAGLPFLIASAIFVALKVRISRSLFSII